MKLITFLARRLQGGVGQNELHRWIRTGQVRVNGSRSRAFDRLAADDAVRLPPFAAPMARREGEALEPLFPGVDLGGGIRVLAAFPDLLALEKPVGLPVQPGTGHTDSVCDRLRDVFSGAAYIPAPAHRLDKATSGILLAGLSHEAQEALHRLFSDSGKGKEGGLEKIYLAWAAGVWPYTDERVLRDVLRKEHGRAHGGAARELTRVVGGGAEKESGIDAGKEARSRVALAALQETPFGAASLMKITLETGRTHQIRAQLSSRGHPIIGDPKYGGPRFSRMLLHAHALFFPWQGKRVAVVSDPKWPDPFGVPADASCMMREK